MIIWNATKQLSFNEKGSIEIQENAENTFPREVEISFVSGQQQHLTTTKTHQRGSFQREKNTIVKITEPATNTNTERVERDRYMMSSPSKQVWVPSQQNSQEGMEPTSNRTETSENSAIPQETLPSRGNKSRRERKPRKTPSESSKMESTDSQENQLPPKSQKNRNRKNNHSTTQTTIQDTNQTENPEAISSPRRRNNRNPQHAASNVNVNPPLPTPPANTQMDPTAASFVPKEETKNKPRKPRKKNPPKASKPDDVLSAAQRKERDPAIMRENNEKAKEAKEPKRAPPIANQKKVLTKSSKENESKSKSSIEVPVGHSALASDIIDRLQADSYECIICSDTLKRHVTTWSCGNCYLIFHLYCIKKWSLVSDEGTTSWRCPGCQYVSLGKPVPKCFCGKLTDPPVNPYLIPHSCGEICGKTRRNSSCPHRCALPCHPGHCPPCAALGKPQTCFCGKDHYRLRCGEEGAGKSCGKICGKRLGCSTHKCQEICHVGPCEPCPKKETQKCFCGASQSSQPCGSGTLQNGKRHYSCGNICGRPLSCGNHSCSQVCHVGECGTCPKAPSLVTMCPCGKIPLPLLSTKPRTSCTDPIPTCPNRCGKILGCGHGCPEDCHLGACPPCQESVKVLCRCGASSTSGPCFQSQEISKTFRCHKKCKTLKSCSRHTCGEECCPANPLRDPNGLDVEGKHICSFPCGKKLPCKKHLCDRLCHAGKCGPCHVTSHTPLVCECGATRVEPPILCSQKLPECSQACVRVRPCGHQDGHACHARNTPCPPCTLPTPRLCDGGHSEVQVPCSQRHVSCGKICGKTLGCGNHQCRRVCHFGSCQSPADPLRALGILQLESQVEADVGIGLEGKSCGQTCGIPRTLCSHACALKCHPELSACPKVPCRQRVTVRCACQRRRAEMECMRGGPDDCPSKSSRELPCDEQCAALARRKQLEEAFGPPPPTYCPYPSLLLSLAQASPLFVSQVEQRFEELINGVPLQISIGPLNSIQRRIVHELAAVYRLETASVDPEPHRRVIVSKRSDSFLPSPLLSTLLADRTKLKAVLFPSPSPSPSTSSVPEVTTYALLLSDLTPEVKSHHIQSALRPFEGYYSLKWLDDFSALLFFKDSVRMRSALYLLSGRFTVQEYKDKELTPTEGGSGGESKKSWRSVGPPRPPQFQGPPPVEDSNFFSSLEGKTNDFWGDEEETSRQQESQATQEISSQEGALSSPSEGHAFLDSWEAVDDPDMALAIKLSLEESQKQSQLTV